ncbi:MAG: MATE family efflux transporter [Chthonomonas sp.]|nr:MATE family efflux transporter [Chthonomonas sp.]
MVTTKRALLKARRRMRVDGKVVWALAWPAVALNGLQVVNSLLDTFFIGHLNTNSLTAHGAALNVIFLMFSLAMTISVASTAMVARAYGAQQPDEYREANTQCLSLALVVGIILSASCLIIAPLAAPYLVPAGNTEAANLFKNFLTAYAFGLPATAIFTTLSGSMRGIGDTKSPMVISGIQILLHMTLNFFFIYPNGRHGFMPFDVPGLGLGLTGAGIALAISGWVSAIIYFLYAKRTKLGRARLKMPSPDWVKRIQAIAVPSALQAILRVGSFTFFTIILRNTPTATDALAALRVGIALESMMFMPAFGLSVAAGALVGQSLGAKDPDRAERLGWTAGHYAAIVILALSVPIFIYAPQIAAMLTGGDKPGVAIEAANYIRILIATEIMFGYAMVLIGAMQGAGDAKRTMWITIATLWAIRVPLAFGLTHPALGLGSTGGWIAMSLSQVAQGLFAIVYWKRGQWKTVVV